MGEASRIKRIHEKLDAAALTLILKAIAEDASITTLELQNTALTPSLAVQLADFLETNTSLLCVDLKGNPIGEHGANCLAASLKNNQTLQSFSLSNCGLKSHALKKWEDFYQERKNQTLQLLNLSHNQIDDDGIDSIAIMLLNANTAMRLDLRYNWLSSVSIHRIADVMKTSPCVISLRLEHNSDIEGDDATVASLKKIEFFLRRNKAAYTRSQVLHQIVRIKMSALDVEVCHFDHVVLSIKDADLLRDALNENRSIIELRMQDNGLPEEAIKRILKGLHSSKSLRVLEFLNNNIGDGGMYALSELLSQQTALRTILISNSIPITSENGLSIISNRTASAMHHAVANFALISSLSLSNCGLTDFEVGVIVSGIAWNGRMQVLDLKNNKLSDRCVHVFAHMLHRCKIFYRLDLSNNCLTIPGILPLVSAASSHSAMRVLLLGRFRSFDNHAFDCVIRCLRQSTSLIQVELHTTVHKTETAKVLAELNAHLSYHHTDAFVQEQHERVLKKQMHIQQSRYRALVRQEAIQFITNAIVLSRTTSSSFS